MYVQLVLALLMFQQIPPSPIPSGTQKDAAQKQTSTQSTTPQENGTASGIGSGESRNDSTNKTDQKDDSGEKRLYHAYEWATILGVVGGWLVLIFIGRQTNSMIKAERAWVMVEVRGPATPSERHRLVAVRDKKGHPLYGEESGKVTDILPVLFVRNQGRTPGWIHEINIRAEIVDRDAIPAKPDFGKKFKKIKEIRPAPVGVDVPRSACLSIDGETGEDLKGLPQLILVYGFVTYRDIFRKTRKTVFGACIYGDDMIMPVEHPAYHETT